MFFTNCCVLFAMSCALLRVTRADCTTKPVLQHPGRDLPIEIPIIDLSTRNELVFKVKGEADFLLILQSHASDSLGFFRQIVIGSQNNSKSVIRECHDNTNVCLNYAPYTHHPLSPTEFRFFWLTWTEKHVAVGQGRQPKLHTFMEHDFSEALSVDAVLLDGRYSPLEAAFDAPLPDSYCTNDTTEAQVTSSLLDDTVYTKEPPVSQSNDTTASGSSDTTTKETANQTAVDYSTPASETIIPDGSTYPFNHTTVPNKDKKNNMILNQSKNTITVSNVKTASTSPNPDNVGSTGTNVPNTYITTAPHNDSNNTRSNDSNINHQTATTTTLLSDNGFPDIEVDNEGGSYIKNATTRTTTPFNDNGSDKSRFNDTSKSSTPIQGAAGFNGSSLTTAGFNTFGSSSASNRVNGGWSNDKFDRITDVPVKSSNEGFSITSDDDSFTKTQTISTLPSSTPKQVTLSKKLKACRCIENKNQTRALRPLPLQNLLMSKGNFSASVRRRISVPDDRPSSKAIGATGIILILVPVLLMLASDLLPHDRRSRVSP